MLHTYEIEGFESFHSSDKHQIRDGDTSEKERTLIW